MIPKTIHYCWFGKQAKPDDIKTNISKWKDILYDYEIKEWNESNFPINNWVYTKEAYKEHKYAFVSDVCRLYALYTEGGIYLDTDVEVIKSFNQFINLDSFAGYEALDFIGTGIIGATKGTPWIKDFLQTYSEDHFILPSGNLKLFPNVIRLRDFFRNYKKINTPTVFPIDYFCAKDWITGEIKKTSNTICIHHYKGSWNIPQCKRDILRMNLRCLWRKVFHFILKHN